ncbi:hypothetical protein [Nostoc sp. JL23]|uniref:hypothetical protein n=1 Tax=Nostoc sp. JL23 TaxID=2815394 RepID=UPI001DF8C0EB|nr:hypothetical protein [Nostoc sp. JL23]MBN3875235.1 hypothetical protein [Nostoc sp. JL23]
MNLKIDPTRWANKEEWEGTGVYVRATFADGSCGVVEISHLEKASLLDWLKSTGGDNRIAENCVGILLGHGSLHESQEVQLPPVYNPEETS